MKHQSCENCQKCHKLFRTDNKVICRKWCINDEGIIVMNLTEKSIPTSCNEWKILKDLRDGRKKNDCDQAN